MHPYVVERLVENRQRDVARLRSSAHEGPSAWEVGQWRRRASRALLALTVAVAVPRAARRPARQSASALLGLSCGADGA
jgi:hypothetical protein